METKHTPGPWSLSKAYPFAIEREVPGLADGYDSYVVAESKTHSLVSRTEAEANASLIAAAPEMLAVLDACMIVLKNRDQDAREVLVYDAVRAVIGKATAPNL